MKKDLLLCMIVFSLLTAASTAGAQAVKLRHTASLYVDEKGTALSKPEGAGCNDEYVVIADTGNGQLLKYAYQQGMFKFEGEVKIPELSNPGKVQLNSQGEIFVFDEKKLHIVRISPEGTFSGLVQFSGVPGGEAVSPRSFAIDSRDNIYILDIGGERVLALDRSGKCLREIKFPEGYGFFSDITVNGQGTVFAVDTVGTRIYSAAANDKEFGTFSESLKESVRFPTSIVSDRAGFLFVVDRNGGVVLTLNEGGSVQGRDLAMGWKEGMLRYPSQACVSRQSTLFIADRENNRVQAFAVVK